MSRHSITRRDFLRQAGASALVIAAGMPACGEQEMQKKARVVLIRDQDVIDGEGRVRGEILEHMFDEATATALDVNSHAEAWERIVSPTDVVGIKTNVWRYLRTPTELEDTMKARIMAVGVEEENIAIDDRGVLSDPVFGRATALINVRPMRAHHWSGVGGLLKNYIMFSPSPPDYHPDSCVDLGALWKLPIVEGKTRLNVLVMLTPQFNCLGPHHFDREYTWPYSGLLVGTDPVALDAVGLRILEAKRRLYFEEDSPMRPPAKHIAAAEKKHGVGIADPAKIDLVKLGWDDGVLI
ncbi:MAG: twin-arginine translocation signal domain-containing protein [Bacteroidota bacterium]